MVGQARHTGSKVWIFPQRRQDMAGGEAGTFENSRISIPRSLARDRGTLGPPWVPRLLLRDMSLKRSQDG